MAKKRVEKYGDDPTLKPLDSIGFDPRTLILEAADRSGLLKEVAEYLWFVRKYRDNPKIVPAGVHPENILIERLADAFDDHTCLAGNVANDVLCPDRPHEDVPIEPAPGEEEREFKAYLAQFLSQAVLAEMCREHLDEADMKYHECWVEGCNKPSAGDVDGIQMCREHIGELVAAKDAN